MNVGVYLLLHFCSSEPGTVPGTSLEFSTIFPMAPFTFFLCSCLRLRLSLFPSQGESGRWTSSQSLTHISCLLSKPTSLWWSHLTCSPPYVISSSTAWWFHRRPHYFWHQAEPWVWHQHRPMSPFLPTPGQSCAGVGAAGHTGCSSIAHHPCCSPVSQGKWEQLCRKAKRAWVHTPSGLSIGAISLGKIEDTKWKGRQRLICRQAGEGSWCNSSGNILEDTPLLAIIILLVFPTRLKFF